MKSLHNLSPLNVVERGFSLVTSEGQLIRSSQQVHVGSPLEIQLAKGKIKAEVVELIEG